MLVINAGTDRGGGTGRAIGQPLLGIGYNGYVGVGDYYGIGLGYLFDLYNQKYCCDIGCVYLIQQKENVEIYCYQQEPQLMA